MTEGTTIGDVLGMDVEDAMSDAGFDFDFDEEQYDQHSRFERTMAFDIMWDELSPSHPKHGDLVDDDGYPRDLVENDEIAEMLCSNRDRRYRIEYDGTVRTVSATGVALYAFLDPDAEVSFDDE